MTELFIDTDVIIDFLTDRKPFSSEAVPLFTMLDQKKVKGYTSSLSFSNLYYVLKKYNSQKKVLATLNELIELLGILKVDGNIIHAALASEFRDLEDAIQYYTALESKKIDVIITRNIKDYKKSELAVMAPETYIKTYKQSSTG